MSGYEMCPWCGADLRDHTQPGPEPDKHYLRTVGIVLPHAYDGLSAWQCPDCGRLWNRWNPYENRRRHDLAREWIDRNQPDPEPMERPRAMKGEN
jgi:hypothetical protein